MCNHDSTMATLRQLRLSKGMSLRDVGGNPTHVGHVEKGLKEPGPELIRRLAEVYSCTTDEIYGAWMESHRLADSQKVAS